MLKLLIVDDEPQIVNWLFEMLSSAKELDLDIYKAMSGSTALEWLDRTKIDIVLSDICMPGIDGMELLKRIRDKWPECRVIFLTGYHEFEYVYKAIKYEGVSYLLKTEGDIAIKNSVKVMIVEIEKDHKDLEIISKAREHRKLLIPFLQKECIHDIIQKNIESPKLLQDRFNELEIPLISCIPVLLLIGRLDTIPKNISSSQRSELFESVKIITDRYLANMNRCFNIVYKQDILLWLIQPKKILEVNSQNVSKANMWNETILFVKDTLETIQKACRESLDLTISFAILTEASKWEDISEQFSSLKQLLNYSTGLGAEMLVTDKNLYNSGINVESSYDDEFLKANSELKKIDSLETYIERGQEESFYPLLHDITGCLVGVICKNYYPALQIYYSISAMFLSYINKWKLSDKISKKIDLSLLIWTDDRFTWKEMVEFFFKLSNVIFEIQKSEQEHVKYDAIKFVLQYINEHYNQEISLVKLSELVYFNPSYLSRLFKQVTGDNVSDYIGNLRLVKSKELLKNSALRINAIAVAVGYESPHYFARLFKKATNMTPQEYRNNIWNK